MTQKLVLCDCLGSQSVDADAIEKACGLACTKPYNSLCMDQLDAAAKELAEGDVIIACQQERQVFEELAEELDVPSPGFVDLRDRAGWGEGDGTPKMAALAAEAALQAPIAKSVDVISEGTCLILAAEAKPDTALQAAADLCDTLAVTVLLSEPSDIPTDRRFDCVTGTVKTASGALGGFTIKFDGLQQVIPGGRGAFGLTAPQDGAASDCDIVLDLSGGSALFPAPEKREGYLRADPSHPPSVAKAVFAAAQLVGTFEKPLYVRLETSLCAHSRAEKPACSNCLNVCPTGAILSAGEHVDIDPMVCAGCGSCSAVCPSGAITYDAPPVDTLFRRLSTLASTYRNAGGAQAQLLVHDATFGAQMISLGARFGRGLPAHVIPLEVEALSGFGHAEMMAALACGFGHVDILISPKAEQEVIEAQAELAHALADTQAVRLLHPTDPDALLETLYAETPAKATCDPVLPMGSRRQVARLAAKALQPEAEMVVLPEGAPYGAVVVDNDACTLCLSCVSLCPSGALGDNPDMPQLRFQEDACLHEEEPFACIECGTLFGVKSTVEKITEKLAGSHSMFATSDAAKMIQMCENCRVQAQFHSEDNPFQGGERPRVRTSEDYFSKRRDH